MSVLIVTPDIVGPVKNGGVGSACFHYACTLATAGIKTAILFTGDPDSGSAEVWSRTYAQKGIEFLSKHDLPWEGVKTCGLHWHGHVSKAIAQFLRSRKFSYVLFQDWHANGFWTMRCKRMGVAFTDTTLGVIAHSPNAWQKEGMQTFGSNPFDEAALEWEEQEAITAADVLISPSRHMIKWLADHGCQLPPRVVICPYVYQDAAFPALSPIDRDHLIFFGRLETRKGLHLLGDALRSMRANSEALPRKLSLLGKMATVNGVPTKTYLEQLARDLPEVTFQIENDFDYKAAIDYIRTTNGIVVIPSLLDNFPLTVLESITNGFCFIASNVGGIPEMADSKVLFEPTECHLAEKIRELKTLDFAGAKHLYDAASAKKTWLDHVRRYLKTPVASPSIKTTNEEGISVCIPFYRFDSYLPWLIRAFLEMRDPNLQLVLVNDGTPEAECPEFMRLKSKLELLGHILHTQENAGAGAARNKAAELARYDNILFFDADNIPFANLVSALRQAMVLTGADSIGAPLLAVPPLLRTPVRCDALYLYLPPGGPLLCALTQNVLGDSCSLQRRSVFEKLGGFPLNRGYYDDWEYFIKLVGRGYTHFVYPDPLFYYRYHDSGRRTAHTEYEKRRTLWQSLANIDPSKMGDLLAVCASQIYVKQT